MWDLRRNKYKQGHFLLPSPMGVCSGSVLPEMAIEQPAKNKIGESEKVFETHSYWGKTKYLSEPVHKNNIDLSGQDAVSHSGQVMDISHEECLY